MPAGKIFFRLIFAVLFLFTGAALLIYIFFSISLAASLILTFIFITGALAWRFSRMDAPQRGNFLRLLLKGALIGLTATIAYDVVRLLIVRIFRMPISPFKAFPYFGHAIAGESITPEWAFAVGAVYHFVNGVCFSISYCLLLQNKRWFYGVFWALGLEVLMFSVYPTWLNLDAVMAEFTIVSLTGHLAYGAVLGALARQLPAPEFS